MLLAGQLENWVFAEASLHRLPRRLEVHLSPQLMALHCTTVHLVMLVESQQNMAVHSQACATSYSSIRYTVLTEVLESCKEVVQR